MFDFLVRTGITAVALYVAILVVPQIEFSLGDEWWRLVAVALVFGVVNSLVKPFVTAVTFPVRLMTFGLVGFVINGGMLLLVAAAAEPLGLDFAIDTFPPDLTADAVVGAILGSVVISVVTTALSLVDLPRRILT